MRSFFDFLTRMALQFRWITIAIVIMIMVLGGVAATELQQELLPPVEFPQTFVLIQVSGMTSEEVLNFVTLRVENELLAVDGVVNIESQTSGTIGVFLLISTEFGLDKDEFSANIQSALDSVFFPNRSIQAPEGEDNQAFATRLLNEMPADVMLYLAGRNPSFLFQLSPSVWQALPEETIRTLVAYLAAQVSSANTATSALEQLVEAELAPQIDSLTSVARVAVGGGQVLPNESAEEFGGAATLEARSQLLQLSPEVWSVISSRLGLGELNQATVDSIADSTITIPTTAPILPQSWQMNHFVNASDLQEMASFTRTTAAVFNDFVNTAVIKGALGTTEDLSAETLEQVLSLQPSLVNYFEANHLAAMSPELLALLPEDLELDGFTRDALAAASLARDITGDSVAPVPVRLPAAWRINPPTLINFSFADLPLATFSVFSTAAPDSVPAEEESIPVEQPQEEETPASLAFEIGTNPAYADVPEGPALPQLYGVFGELFSYELNTADDLLKMQFPAEVAPLLGGTDGAAFLNLIIRLPQLGSQFTGGNAGQGGAGAFGGAQLAQLTGALLECRIALQDLLVDGAFNLEPLASGMIACIQPEVFSYLVEYDPAFPSRLSPEVYANLAPEVFTIEGFAPLLGEAWNTLSGRPEFGEQPLVNGADVLRYGNGSASTVLNNIKAEIPARFAGYEIRLFDALSPEILAYFAEREEGFYSNLDSGVLLDFSREALAAIPVEVLETLDSEVSSQVQAIVAGEQETAAEQIASQYVSDVPAAREDAPALNSDWKTLENFIPGVEFNNAYDIIRFGDAQRILPPAQFINDFFNSAGGANFAVALLGNMPSDAFFYLADNVPNFVDDLSPRALNLLPAEIFEALPEATQERASAGEVFVPTTQVTRTNAAPALLVTVYKTADANTVAAFAEVEAIMNELDAANPNISVAVAFEQASFIEESISGVVLSGLLGAFFAVINILIFLSGDTWARGGRSITGIIVTILSLALLGGFYLLGFADGMPSGDSLQIAAIFGFGLLAGLIVLLYPGRMPYPSWRSTLVIAVSIPLSIMSALMLMRWLPEIANALLGGYKDNGFVAFILRLAPEGLTLNIMTLSGLTVAVGRLVDDSIVVLENIFRQLQTSDKDKKEVVLQATRDVSVAIFSATSIAVLVFLPLGLTGGLISEFFLPFGLAITYTLLSSFVVAMTVVPLLAYLFISVDNVPKEEETWMERLYVPALKWLLATNLRRIGVLVLAVLSIGFSLWLFSNRPAAFLPNFGEPQISISVQMGEGTGIVETNERVRAIEAIVNEVIPEEDLVTVLTTIGGGGLSFESLTSGGGVSENIASITISVANSDTIEGYTASLEERISPLFTGEEESVSVSAATLSGDGFGGFELVVSGGPLAELDADALRSLNDEVIAALSSLTEITNVSSNLAAEDEEAAQTATTYIRVCDSETGCAPALTFTGELLTEDVINFTELAIETIESQVVFPEGVAVGQGFSSELQTEGFASIFVAIGIASIIIVLIFILVFRSPVYWLAVFFSVLVAPVGAAIALTVTDRVLGISSLIGLLMLLGLVVTNGIVLIDRVGANRTERNLNLYDSLVEAGGRRLRPILMTALTTIIGLVPLALGLSDGAIIAAELGTVVIGGVVSSTILTLLVVPAAYYVFTPVHDFLLGLFGIKPNTSQKANEEQA